MVGSHTATVYSRLGLLGNPSDGMRGAAVAVSIENFYSTVTIESSERIQIVPHVLHDASCFGCLHHLHEHVDVHGYYGGHRLLMATCSRFWKECTLRDFDCSGPAFKLSYDTNIPRQAGLSGSSAIVCGAFNCLLHWYGLEDKWPMKGRPQFLLDVETQELGIAGGLMDRVAQENKEGSIRASVYGGVVYLSVMPPSSRVPATEAAPLHDASPANQDTSFSKPVFKYLPAGGLPPLYLVYIKGTAGRESGQVHAPVKQRFLAGDSEVVAGVQQLACLADDLCKRLEGGEGVSAAALASLMTTNVGLRRQLYTDEGLCATTLEMVRTAQAVGATAKFCGSGGAAVACCPGGDPQVLQLQEACSQKGFSMEKVRVAPQRLGHMP